MPTGVPDTARVRPVSPAKRIPRWVLIRLALAELRHDRLLSLCHILACAATLAPLLLLFGLRYGTMESLRQQLLQDPKNREIRPVFGQTFTPAWISTLRARPDIAFAIGQIRQIATGVDVRLARNDVPPADWVDMDIVPTAPGDPLLLDNEAGIPSKDACVLSSEAAAAIGAKPGDFIDLAVGRNFSGKLELRTLRLHVDSVLALRATTLKKVFLPIQLAENVERYKDGLAVPELGWPGDSGEAIPEYDGVLVCGGLSPQQLEAARLTSGTGVTESRPLTPQEAGAAFGGILPDAGSCRLLTIAGNLVQPSTVQTIQDRLKTTPAQVFPYVAPRQVILHDGTASGKAQPRLVQLQGAPPKLLAALDTGKPNVTGDELVGYCAPQTASGPLAILHLADVATSRELRLPLTLRHAPLPQGVLILPMTLAGRCNALRVRPLEFESVGGIIRAVRRSYTSFRVYAQHLEDVVALTRQLKQAGVAVNAATDRIEFVLELDRNLGILFWLIATVAIIGGQLTLTASLYAAMERRRQDLGVMRLLGVPLRSLTFFPVTQGIVIAGTGLVIALLLFFGGAIVIDGVYAGKREGLGHLCVMHPSHIGAAAGLTVAIAVLAGLLACARLARQDPALTLRDE